MPNPISRVRDGDDEVGIYVEDDLVRLVYYDHQGAAGQFPARMAAEIGEELARLHHQGQLMSETSEAFSEPRTLVFSGHSDDLVNVGGSSEYDEIGSTDATFVVANNSGETRIRVRYSYGGVWVVEAGPTDEAVNMLPVTIGMAHDYSASATVEGVTSIMKEKS